MKILENKGICMVLMLVLIVCGFLFGGYKGLAGQYRKAADVFFVGETGDGICIANDMGERANALTNLQTVAKKYPAANDIEAACEGAAAAVNAYTQAAGDISALFAANTQMETAMTELYRVLDDASLSEKDEKYRQRLYTDFNSRNDTISHDPYYSYAADYNKLLAQFPANVIAALTPAAAAPMMR